MTERAGDGTPGHVAATAQDGPADVVEHIAEALDEAHEASEDAHKATVEAQEASQEAHSAADEAHQAAGEAHQAAGAAQGTAESLAVAAQAPGDQPADMAEELLRDYEPTRGQHPYGRPGRPMAKHSPFYLGFWGGLGVLVAVALANVVTNARSVLVLVVVAAFLAVGLNPAVELLIRRGVKRAWAVLVVSLCLIVLMTLFAIEVIPVMTDQITAISARAPEWMDQLRRNETIADLNRRYGVLDRVEAQFESGAVADQAFGGIIGVGKVVLSAVFSALIVFVLTLYFLASLPQAKRACYRLVPASRRERVSLLGDEVLSRVGGYVAGAFIVATIAGLSAMAFCMAIGLGEYAIALGMVVAVTDFIPLVGATIGATVVTAIGFVTSPGIGVACLVFFVVYQQLENYVIYPRVMSSSVDVPGGVTVIAALLGGALLGIVGALLAVPLAAALLLITREVVARRQDAV
jgi:predicted PurR-regulated permease PerM